jgi:hypothetical protein
MLKRMVNVPANTSRLARRWLAQRKNLGSYGSLAFWISCCDKVPSSPLTASDSSRGASLSGASGVAATRVGGKPGLAQAVTRRSNG